MIELEQFVNARYSSNFKKTTPNVKFVLTPGTLAKIEESKKFNSGNYGLKIRVVTGSRKGEVVWVYYNTQNPGIKLYENESDLAADRKVASVESAQVVKITKATEVIREPLSESIDKMNESISQANKAIKSISQSSTPCESCSLASSLGPKAVGLVGNSEDSKFVPHLTGDVPVLREPLGSTAPYGIRSARCGYREGNYDECIFEGESKPGRFKFSNAGPSKAVPTVAEGRSRDWIFNFPAGATQDMGISISDYPNGTISQIQESYIMLFPRKTLPHIRIEGNRQIVTLPTGETVSFDAKTKDVIGGVMKETGRITSGGRDPAPARVSYSGNGVMIRVDRVGNEPRQKKGNATITKQGRTCHVPVKDLWPGQGDDSPVHFKYPSDQEFEKYLKRTCGFGL